MNRAMMYSGNKKSSRRIFGTFFDVCQNSSGETMEKRSVNRDPNFPECLNAGIGHLLSSSGEKIKVRFRYSQIRRYLQVAMEAEMATLVSAPQFVQRETSSSQQRRETLHMHKSLGIAKFDNENCSLIAKCQIVEVSDADKSTAAHSSQNAQELRLQMLTIPPLLRPRASFTASDSGTRIRLAPPKIQIAAGSARCRPLTRHRARSQPHSLRLIRLCASRCESTRITTPVAFNPFLPILRDPLLCILTSTARILPCRLLRTLTPTY
jgi:hypothetical protein